MKTNNEYKLTTKQLKFLQNLLDENGNWKDITHMKNMTHELSYSQYKFLRNLLESRELYNIYSVNEEATRMVQLVTDILNDDEYDNVQQSLLRDIRYRYLLARALNV